MAVSVTGELDPRGIVRQALEHLDHVLPGQAPIHDFVHHNTLHGFQHLPFEQALAEFTELTGIDCYLSAEQFREFYRQQRITDRDLDAALQQRFGSALTEPLAGCPGAARRELYRAVLLHDVQVITPQQLAWRLRESAEFASETCGGRPLTELWQAVSAKLELPAAELHPEDMLELSAEQLDDWLPQMDDAESPARWFGRVGDGRTWRGVLLALAGKDILDSVRPQLIRLCASLLDEGLAAWRLPQRQELGLYAAWRQRWSTMRCRYFTIWTIGAASRRACRSSRWTHRAAIAGHGVAGGTLGRLFAAAGAGVAGLVRPGQLAAAAPGLSGRPAGAGRFGRLSGHPPGVGPALRASAVPQPVA